MGEEEKSVKKKWTAVRVVRTLVLLLILAGLGVAGYFYMGYVQYYKTHFYNGTFVNGIDCSELTEEEAAAILQDKINNWSINIQEREGVTESITAEQVQMTYENDGSLADLFFQQQPLLWIVRLYGDKNYEVPSGFTYSEEALRNCFNNLQQVREYVPMKNAELVQREDGTYAIEPEVTGTQMKQDDAYDALLEAVVNRDDEIDLEEFYLSPTVFSDDEELVDQMEDNNTILSLTRADIHLKFDKDEIVINADQIKQWMVKDKKERYKIDEKKVREFVQGLYDKYNAGHEGELFKDQLGFVHTLTFFEVPGWNIDVDKSVERYMKAIYEGYQGSLGPVMVRLDENGNPYPETYVEISIDEQRMWYVVNGEVTVDTPIVTGGADVPNPEEVPQEYVISMFNSRSTPSNGIWTIKKKESPHFMRGPQLSDGSYEYTLSTTYWLPFNGQIGIHDNYERLLFGGRIYETAGSHGCVNTPYENVEKIFNTIEPGCLVVLYGMDTGEEVFAAERDPEQSQPQEFRHPLESSYNS